MQNINLDLDLKGKLVFVRVDFNVPLQNKKITSTKRIKATVPQIDFLREKGARIVLCSHLGRPEGKIDPSLSLKPVYDYLVNLYGKENVLFANAVVGERVEQLKSNLKPSQILLLENVRFESGEEECSEEFAEELAKQIDVFIDEAFAVSHRKSASNYLMAQKVESYFGFNHAKEREALTLKDKEKPILAILGGAKVSDKIKLISSLLEKVNKVYIGGAMAFTFLKSQEIEIGKSLVEDDCLQIASEILNRAKELGVELFLPQDVVVAQSIEDEKGAVLCDIASIPKDQMGLDIGDRSIKQIKELINASKTVFWNGPLGVASVKAFENGTIETIKALAKAKAYSIIGGGDSVEVVERLGLEKEISFVSTGGGASLKYIQKD